MTWDFEKGEIININKPENWTSFDVVKKIRNTIKVKKVGHAGTLDPFATGVLIICTGNATRKVTRLMGLEKEYEAVILLGQRSNTYDRTGTIEKIMDDVNHITREQVEAVLQKYIGKIEQRIPPFSAAKVGGKRLYELARKGRMVENLTKPVEIFEISVLDFTPPYLRLRLRCGKGTYVRTLADDLGRDLGTGALLLELKRTRIGPYSLDGAWSVEEFVKQVERIRGRG